MATKGVVCSYQEVIDLHTESDHVTVLGIHTPTGDTPRKMFKGFFDQYKKYKYLGCSMKLVPAARLPADPMHVSIEAGDTFISPRDLMNPILFHGCHGDDLGTILNTLYGENADIMDSIAAIDVESIGVSDNVKTGFYEILERLYYRALTDKTWKKAAPNRGFQKSGLHPLVYSLAANRQIMPGSMGDALAFNEDNVLESELMDPTMEVETISAGKFNYKMKNNLQLMTPRLTSLGWMDTRNVLTAQPDNFGINVSSRVVDLQEPMAEMVNYAELPKLYMGCVLLPPAYLTEQYFRMIINHRFAFKNFRGISFTPTHTGVPSYADANEDLFEPDKFEDIEVPQSGGDAALPFANSYRYNDTTSAAYVVELSDVDSTVLASQTQVTGYENQYKQIKIIDPINTGDDWIFKFNRDAPFYPMFKAGLNNASLVTTVQAFVNPPGSIGHVNYGLVRDPTYSILMVRGTGYLNGSAMFDIVNNINIYDPANYLESYPDNFESALDAWQWLLANILANDGLTVTVVS